MWFLLCILSINPFVFTLHTYHFSKMIWPSCLSNVMQLFLDTRQYIDISFHFLIWSDAYAVQSNFACRIYGWFDPPWEVWMNLFFKKDKKLEEWQNKSGQICLIWVLGSAKFLLLYQGICAISFRKNLVLNRGPHCKCLQTNDRQTNV